jgi:hypothetical protein
MQSDILQLCVVLQGRLLVIPFKGLNRVTVNGKKPIVPGVQRSLRALAGLNGAGLIAGM